MESSRKKWGSGENRNEETCRKNEESGRKKDESGRNNVEMGRKNVNMGTDGPNGTVWGRKMLKRVEKLRKPG